MDSGGYLRGEVARRVAARGREPDAVVAVAAARERGCLVEVREDRVAPAARGVFRDPCV